jgi:DNA-binding winged helix-turn-helix (wHTH) protein
MSGNGVFSAGGQPMPPRAKVFDTLRVLVQNHGRLLGKDELMNAVWPDAIVEEGNLAHNLAVLRKSTGKQASCPGIRGNGSRPRISFHC